MGRIGPWYLNELVCNKTVLSVNTNGRAKRNYQSNVLAVNDTIGKLNQKSPTRVLFHNAKIKRTQEVVEHLILVARALSWIMVTAIKGSAILAAFGSQTTVQYTIQKWKQIPHPRIENKI